MSLRFTLKTIIDEERARPVYVPRTRDELIARIPEECEECIRRIPEIVRQAVRKGELTVTVLELLAGEPYFPPVEERIAIEKGQRPSTSLAGTLMRRLEEEELQTFLFFMGENPEYVHVVVGFTQFSS